MGLFLESQVWDTIYNTFVNIFSSIGAAFSNNIVVSILTFAILLILIIYRVIRNKYTTELLTYKAITRINEYLAKNPFITEENLVEFNRLMMKSPKTIRFQWQRYIINRDKKPSDFLTEENCVTRPLRINSYKQGLKSFMISSIILCIISACFVIGTSADIQNQFGLVLQGLISPALALLISLIFKLFGNVLYNAIMNDLYYSYTNFEKAIDRAVINMPIAIDYEIIFTSKEIQNGIPALQEFLEQRALYEQEQIERAKESEVEHETYNFEGLDVDGRLIMERAMNETTHYLGNKARLQKDIALAQSEKDSIKKDFDEKSKDYQRNLRDIREEIASLKSKIEVVTNEITRSSLRRQQQAEIEKEQNIEKEIEKETKKYNDKVSKIDSQIQAKEDEIAQAKDIAEKALIDEFEHFSKKVYKELKTDAQKDVQDHVQALENDKNELAILLEEKDKLMAEKLALYEDKANNFDAVQADVEESKVINAELKNQISTLNDEIEAKNQEIFEIKQELESRKREIVKKDEMIDNFKKKKGEVEVYRYFDANGNEFYFDENENPYYLGEDGSPIYYDNENQVSQEYVENIEREEDLTLNENTLMDTSEEGAEDPALNDNIESETSEEGVEAFEENLTEENLVSEEVASEEAPVPAEKPKSTRSRKTKAESEKSESGTKSKKSQSAKQSGTKKKNITKKASEKATDKENDKSDIEQTLNKLAKAAEEKMKTAKAEKTENSSTKKKKKNN